MIYFVDEDYFKLKAWLVELEYRGLSVTPVSDADTAYEVLQAAKIVDLVIIDVMLAASESPETRYGEARSDGNLETGLVLLKDLVDVRPDVFPSRSVLLTNTTNATTYKAAIELAERLGIELIEKTEIEGPRDFGDRIVTYLRKIGTV